MACMPVNDCICIFLLIVSSFQVRDYIHVVDLADGHIAALRKLDESGIGESAPN